ncbi:MAG: FG-GAP repeat protein [Alphaproteobacteria bacterium]|nr:FG-GAP repeat protein [Alphaproteobacteria bacterium]
MRRFKWMAWVWVGLIACEGKDPPTDDSGVEAVTDADGDGYAAAEDCDDADASVRPGAEELCDGVDNDCDGTIDLGASDASSFYADGDGDGYGDAADVVAACEAPEGRVDVAGDCDDSAPEVHPEAAELCDGLDNNCDGLIDEGLVGSWYPDADGDGWGADAGLTETCTPPEGYVQQGGDCDDSASAANPGLRTEICGDGLDNDCDGDFGECGLWGDVPVQDAAWAHVLVGEAGDEGGYALASAGDLDGDGVEELVVSAPQAGSERGSVWLFSPAGLSGEVRVEDIALRTWRVSDSDETGDLGFAVDAGLDVTGDGVVDVVISDPLDSTHTSYGGAVWIGDVSDLGAQTLDRDGGTLVFGEEEITQLGRAARLVDDLSGDGVVDLVASAPGTVAADGNRTGAVYGFSGPLSGERPMVAAEVRILAEVGGSEFGQVLECADIDGDGSTDLAVSAYRETVISYLNSGAVHFFTGPLSGNLVASDHQAWLRGDRVGTSFGYDIALRDVDGDGYIDLLAGAPGYPGEGINAGEAALFMGPLSGEYDYLDADAVFLGADDFEGAGYAVELPGDLDNDGVDDWVVGTPAGSLSDQQEGLVYVVYSPSGGGVVVASQATLQGSEANGAFGWTLLSGDFGGDGDVDLAVSQPNRWGRGAAVPGGIWLLTASGF